MSVSSVGSEQLYYLPSDTKCHYSFGEYILKYKKNILLTSPQLVVNNWEARECVAYAIYHPSIFKLFRLVSTAPSLLVRLLSLIPRYSTWRCAEKWRVFWSNPPASMVPSKDLENTTPSGLGWSECSSRIASLSQPCLQSSLESHHSNHPQIARNNWSLNNYLPLHSYRLVWANRWSVKGYHHRTLAEP